MRGEGGASTSWRNVVHAWRATPPSAAASAAASAADGARSATRRLAGIRTVGWRYDASAVVGAVATPPQPSFRERYLSIDPATGVITTPDKLAGCVFNGTSWVCDCPDAGNPAPTVVTTGTTKMNWAKTMA